MNNHNITRLQFIGQREFCVCVFWGEFEKSAKIILLRSVWKILECCVKAESFYTSSFHSSKKNSFLNFNLVYTKYPVIKNQILWQSLKYSKVPSKIDFYVDKVGLRIKDWDYYV